MLPVVCSILPSFLPLILQESALSYNVVQNFGKFVSIYIVLQHVELRQLGIDLLCSQGYSIMRVE